MKSDKQLYTAEDIQAYLDGKLSPYERHALEKAALDDPFLAEAMEGYETMPDTGWQSQLQQLKDNFPKKNEPAKVVAMHNNARRNTWRVAAGLLILILGAGAVYLVNRQAGGSKQPLAKTEIPAADTGNVNPAPVTLPPVASNNIIPETQNPQEIASLTPGKTNTITVAPNTVTADLKQAAARKQNVAKDNASFFDTAYYNDKVRADEVVVNAPARSATTSGTLNPAPSVHPENEAVVFAKKEQDRISRERAQANNGVALNAQQLAVRNFSAQVVSADNSPLPFANISVRSGNFDTYADAKGNVRLVSPDSLLTVEVKSLGYQSRYYTLRSNQPLTRITLVEDKNAQKELTVVKAKSSNGRFISRRAMLMRDSVMNVEPADGWDNYNTYIANNIDIPDDILKNNLHGEVEVSFDVKPNGSIANIKVDKSLCDNCDEAVKRIIEQGPQWKVRKGRTPSGKVKVKF